MTHLRLSENTVISKLQDIATLRSIKVELVLASRLPSRLPDQDELA
jgi:hypothetical protein